MCMLTFDLFIVCVQLIKQSTANPSLPGTLSVWKLLYLCLHVTPPLEMRHVLLAHLVKYGSCDLPSLRHAEEDAPTPLSAAASAASAAESKKPVPPPKPNFKLSTISRALPGASVFTVDLSSVRSLATLCYVQYKWLLASMVRRSANIAALKFGTYNAATASAAASAAAAAVAALPVLPLYTPPHLWRNPTAVGEEEAALLDVAYVTRITSTQGVMTPWRSEDEVQEEMAAQEESKEVDQNAWFEREKYVVLCYLPDCGVNLWLCVFVP
jgi:hypothetical protein